MGKIRYFFAAFLGVFIYLVLQMPLSRAHWWQTFMEEEQSGQVVLTCFEKEKVPTSFTTFKMCLNVVGEKASLDIETKRRGDIPDNNSNADFINYQKVWKFLEKQEIGDTLSAKWVISNKNKVIFTTLDNDKNIGGTGNVFDKIFDGIWYFAAFVLLIGVFFIITAPKKT